MQFPYFPPFFPTQVSPALHSRSVQLKFEISFISSLCSSFLFIFARMTTVHVISTSTFSQNPSSVCFCVGLIKFASSICMINFLTLKLIKQFQARRYCCHFSFVVSAYIFIWWCSQHVLDFSLWLNMTQLSGSSDEEGLW